MERRGAVGHMIRARAILANTTGEFESNRSGTAASRAASAWGVVPTPPRFIPSYRSSFGVSRQAFPLVSLRGRVSRKEALDACRMNKWTSFMRAPVDCEPRRQSRCGRTDGGRVASDTALAAKRSRRRGLFHEGPPIKHSSSTRVISGPRL